MTQYFTAEGLKKVKEELHYLKTTKNKEIIKLISEAVAFGDLKENAAYHDARDKMAFLRMRIAELESAINEAVISEKKETDKIQIGSEVLILLNGKEEKYHIVSSGESDILKNKMSYQSPLGQKLIGQRVGQEFEFLPAQAGQGGEKKVKVKILEIK